MGETKPKNLCRGRSQMETSLTMQDKKTGGCQATLHIEQGSSKLMVKIPFNKNSSADNSEVSKDIVSNKKKDKKLQKKRKTKREKNLLQTLKNLL